jgi:hypothetical protein
MKAKLEMQVGVLAAVSNIAAKGTRSSLKAIFTEAGGDVAYVDFRKGKTMATVRFKDAASAKTAVAAFPAGSGSSERINARLLEGKEEQDYWSQLLGSAAVLAECASVSSSTTAASTSTCTIPPLTPNSIESVPQVSGEADASGRQDGTKGAKRRRKTAQLKAQRIRVVFDDDDDDGDL